MDISRIKLRNLPPGLTPTLFSKPCASFRGRTIVLYSRIPVAVKCTTNGTEKLSPTLFVHGVFINVLKDF